MSTSYNTYLGPFILIHNPPIKSEIEYHACQNKKCSKFQEESGKKFCDTCGGKITLVHVPCEVPIDLDCYEELGEKLSDSPSCYGAEYDEEYKHYEILIPNVGYGIDRIDQQDAYSASLVNIIDSGTPEVEMELFTEFFKKEIAYLKKKFGEKACQIHWGQLNWAD